MRRRVPAFTVSGCREQLVAIRGLSKTEIVIVGILVQAEAIHLIPSVAATLAKLLPESRTDPDTRRRHRLSQQRTRARRRGILRPPASHIDLPRFPAPGPIS